MSEGLMLVNTGNGKGKTTAAIGLGLRAAGHGMKVLMLQFFKGPWPTGECAALKRLEPDFTIIPLGQGFIKTRKEEHTESTRENARASWDYAKQEILSDVYNVIILDEINNMIYHGLVSVEEVITVLKERPKRLTVVLTGRNAHEKVVEMADMVTEMREIKHHYQRGIRAQKGIEF